MRKLAFRFRSSAVSAEKSRWRPPSYISTTRKTSS